MHFQVVFCTVLAFLVVHVNGNDMKDPMGGGPMNETMPANMTGGELMHPGKGDMEAIESKESEEAAPRSRRGMSNDIEQAGKNTWDTVKNAGQSAVSTAENIGQKGLDGANEIKNTVETGAKDLWNKAKDAV